MNKIENFCKKNWGILFLLSVLFLAFFFRFWRLSEIPPGLYPDIAVNGTDAINVLRAGNYQWFYLANNGREGLFMNLIALSFYMFGISVWSIRIVSVIFGFSTVLGLYFLTKELFNKKIALFSSFFLAVCFWHVNFSRMGFRAIVLPFVLIYSFLFLFRGFRNKHWINFVIGGLFFGLGLHTYISWRLAPVILIIWVLLKIIFDKGFLKKYWLKLIVYILSALASALPLLYYFLKHPVDFMGRAGEVSVFNQPQAIKNIIFNIVKVLAMFNIFGDWNWRHNLAGAPMFTIPLGILFLGGLILAIIKLFKDKSKDKKFIYLFILLWFIIMLLPTIFSSEGIPHALRALGVVPVCVIFAGFFTSWLFDLKYWKKNCKNLKIFILIIIISLVGALEFNRYFFAWAESPQTYSAFNENLVNIGNYLNSLPQSSLKYVIVNEGGVSVGGLPMPAQTIKFITYNKSYPKYLLPEDLRKIRAMPKGTVIVFMKKDDNLLDYLKNNFKDGKVEKIDLTPGSESEFYIFYIDKYNRRF